MWKGLKVYQCAVIAMKSLLKQMWQVTTVEWSFFAFKIERKTC